MEDKIKKYLSEAHRRSMSFSKDHIDVEQRTVEISFSSEDPYMRWFGIEILDHSKGAVDLSRLNNMGAVLVDHAREDLVGVIERTEIGSDRKGRATIRFGKSARAEEVFQDVQDGIRTKVSVGYTVEKMVLEKSDNDVESYRVTNWTPFEVSLVSVPADDTVGIGRSKDEPLQLKQKRLKMTEEEKRALEEKEALNLKKQNEAVAKVKQEELSRIRTIEKLGKDHGLEKEARGYLETGDSVVKFKDLILDKRGKSTPMDIEVKTDLGAPKKDVANYRILRAINAMATGDWRGAELEREMSDAVAKSLGKKAQGFFVPYDVQKRAFKRDLSVGVDTAGGYLVDTDLGSMIDLLRNRTVIGRLGAIMLGGLRGHVDIPKQSSASTAYWVNEGGDVTVSQPSVGQVVLTPKTVGGFIPLTRRFLMQTSIDADRFVENDLSRVLALAIDLAALNGSGSSSQPLGIANTTGVLTSTISSAGNPTWTETVEFEIDLETSNALDGSLAWVMHPGVKGNMKVKEKASNTAQFIWPEGGEVNGYRAIASNQAESNQIIFGDWSSLVVGEWGVLDINVDTSTNSASGGVRVIALKDVDIALRHPEAFCINA